MNSIFSALSGLAMLLFSDPLNRLFHIVNLYVFPSLGANLLVFAVFVAYVSSKQLHNKILVLTITTLDSLWVLGSVAIVCLGLFNLSQNGYVIISIVAVWILFLAYMQFKNRPA